MADIISTLENRDGDTLYPIAGGMVNDSITNAMLKDNSVTTSKIADGAVTAAKLGNNISIPVVTMQTTDPGEGATLATNHFIGVYQ